MSRIFGLAMSYLVTVTARNPTPIAGVLKFAGVRITRTRGDLDGA